MNAKNFASTLMVVGGLLFLSGAGCSDKDKDAQLMAQHLRARLDLKEKELACRVAALAKECKEGDTSCTDERAKALAECDKIKAEFDKAGGNSTTTVTNTGTSTSTSTDGATP